MKKSSTTGGRRAPVAPPPSGVQRRAVWLWAGVGLLLAGAGWECGRRLMLKQPAAPIASGPAAGEDAAETRLRAAIAAQPRNATAHAELGRNLLSIARPISALWELQEALALGSRDPMVRMDEARALAAAGQRTLAMAALRAVLRDHPEVGGVRERLAALLLEAGEPTEAAAVLRRPAAGDDPTEGALLLGRAEFALGRVPEAEAAFRRYARLAPPETARFQPLGRFLLATGQPEAARRALMQDQRVAFRTAELHTLLGLTLLQARPAPALGKAAAAFAVALHFDPHFARARAGLGEALERQGAREPAAAQYQEAIRLDPEVPEPHERLALLLGKLGERVPALQQRGIAATVEDQLPEAESAFRQMLQADPTDLDAIQSVILTCVAMKRIGRSRPAIEALQRLPFDASTANRVADLYLITGTRAPVAPLAAEWQRQQPKAAACLRLRARLALDDLRVSEGIQLYQQAWAVQPQDAETAGALGLAWGRVPTRSNLERGREWLQRAEVLAPADARNHDDLAEVDRQLGQLATARDEYLRALDLNPQLTAAYNGLTRLAPALGEPAQASSFGEIARAQEDASRQEEQLRQRVWDAPGDAAARLPLAQMLTRTHEWVKARYHLQVALARRPGWEPARDLLRVVEALQAWS